MRKAGSPNDEALLNKQGSPDRFGYSWERFSQLSPEQEEQFRRWTSALDSVAWRGKRILDVGCGAGRNSFWAMKWGAAGGVAVDVDGRSLDAARANLHSYPSIEVRDQSIYELAETDEFDITFSIGVIHHLGDPERAVRNMTAATKPGGKVLLWLYGYENNEWIVRYVDPVRIKIFSKMPLPLLHVVSILPTVALFLAVRLGLRNIEYFRLLRTLPFWHLRHIVFDQLLPKIARYYRKDEAVKLLQQAGLTDIRATWVNEMSWSVVGTKPID